MGHFESWPKWPPISHLLFADDIKIFGEAFVSHIYCVLGCLNTFCEATGQKVSVDKTRIFFL